jgi:RNA polymerase sigma-70 factor, ECF subfamily
LVNGIVWRAIKKADKFKGDSKFSTWFYRIVTNECNRFLRSHKERQEISFEEEFPIEPFGDLGVEVQQLVQGLDDRDFALFKMVAQGENFETIAETLHIKVGAAKTRWSRLRGRLRDAAL